MPLVREARDSRRCRPRHDAQFLERVFAADAGERTPLSHGRMNPGECLAAKRLIAQELHEHGIGREMGTVGMVGRECDAPWVGDGEKPFEPDRPLPGMDQALFPVGDRQHAAAALQMQVVRHPGGARRLREMLRGGRVARHGHGVAEQDLPDVEREGVAGVEVLHERGDSRPKRTLVEITPGITVKLDVGEVGGQAVERAHRFEHRAPVARQAEIRRVHMERVREADRLHGPHEPVEDLPGRDLPVGEPRVEVVMVAASAVFPKRRPARIGHLHGPATAGMHFLPE